MSGAFVPYHQRQNKAVDRHLFIDLLGRLNRRISIADYAYVSFGGAFLEDFKLIHASFGNRQLISLEINEIAHKRQLFNLPLSCIQCLRSSSGDFIDSYAIDNNAIIWLDYASARDTRVQFSEFQALLPKLRRYDIVKITLNANPETLRASKYCDDAGKPETTEVLRKKRFAELEKRIGDFISHEFTPESMIEEEYPRVLSKALEVAANDSLKGRPEDYFQPLMSFAYSDSMHQMFTISGILLPKADRIRFLKDTGLKQFKLATLSWDNYKRIKLPALTAKERLFIDQNLPKWGEKTIQKRLKFWFDKSEANSLKILKNYIEFYRQYPNFHRVLF